MNNNLPRFGCSILRLLRGRAGLTFFIKPVYPSAQCHDDAYDAQPRRDIQHGMQCGARPVIVIVARVS
ncbi:MAG TPA: hypothetical protein DD979_11350 [Gammaproteobacteria bacterium]|nr:hypothetical protein [Gammaproteobacteria bacterium]